MKLHPGDLVGWKGRIARGPFLLWAVILFGLKYNLDRFVLAFGFGRDWSLLSYLNPTVPGAGVLMPAESPMELTVLLILSLPFLWSGVVLTLKRLRSAACPLWLSVLFVVPILKWFLFIALAMLPDRPGRNRPGQTSRIPWLPTSKLGSAALALGCGVFQAIVATWLSTNILKQYGWGLFAGVPFCMGFVAAVIYGANQRRKLPEILAVALLSVLLAGAAFVIIALEGLMCIMMAAPLAGGLASIGALAGYAVHVTQWRSMSGELFSLPLVAIAMMLSTEYLARPEPNLLRVSTEIEVEASPEDVWRHVVSFSELAPPSELLFRLGIAYPIRAEIHGTGPGAVRHCMFSTGAFVEPIVVWDEPRLLSFSVTENPAPMEEWTPYRDVHPPHLQGFLVSRHGQFRLRPSEGERTLVEGTTWYEHGLWPSWYWQLWSDQIIHVIHLRVLRHVKNLAEADRGLIAESRRPP